MNFFTWKFISFYVGHLNVFIVRFYCTLFLFEQPNHEPINILFTPFWKMHAIQITICEWLNWWYSPFIIFYFVDTYSCPGRYRCRRNKNCIPLEQVCDGHFHCKLEDDEELCGMTCPPECSCYRADFNCSYNNLSRNELILNNLGVFARRIISTHASIIHLVTHFQYPYLFSANMSYNQINKITPGIFSNTTNLRMLDLSFNCLTHLWTNTFIGLGKLRELHLKGNRNLNRVAAGAFLGLSDLKHLNLGKHSLTTLVDNQFIGLTSLQILNLSGNRIDLICPRAFSNLSILQELDISENKIREFDRNIFVPLRKMKLLISSAYKFCCITSVNKCLPQPDIFSSCTDLIANKILVYLMWVMGVLGLTGNVGIIIMCIKYREQNQVYLFMILNLGASYLMMSIYLLIIAGADLSSRGHYVELDEIWRSSALCTLSGMAAYMSSIASLLVLLIIAISVSHAMVFPSSPPLLNTFRACITIGIIWLVALLIAAIPVMYYPFFCGQFYGSSTVCLPIHIISQAHPGWHYSFISLTLIPSIVNMMLLLCHIVLLCSMKRSTAYSVNKSDNIIHVFYQVVVNISTNLCCWLPVCYLGKCICWIVIQTYKA